MVKVKQECTEFDYENGTVSLYILEGDEHFSLEFFPTEQDTESFENAEYNNVLSIKDFIEGNYTGYNYNIPTDVTEDECREILESTKKFLLDNEWSK